MLLAAFSALWIVWRLEPVTGNWGNTSNQRTKVLILSYSR